MEIGASKTLNARLVIELFAHMDAGDRRQWNEDQDTRPLSDLGLRQAEHLCHELAREPINAVYSSPALRCRQSIEPLAERFAVPVTILPGLHETVGSWPPPLAWRGDPVSAGALGGAYAAGVGMQALQTIYANHPVGRVAACTHGDRMPALVVYLMGAYDLTVPPPNQTRGGWYTLAVQDDRITVEHHDVLSGFPL